MSAAVATVLVGRGVADVAAGPPVELGQERRERVSNENDGSVERPTCLFAEFVRFDEKNGPTNEIASSGHHHL